MIAQYSLPKILSTMLVFFLVIETSVGKNLTYLGSVGSPSYELMDIEIEGNFMILTGGLGGASLYSIAEPQQPELLANMVISQFQYGRTYKWDIAGTKAIGTARDQGMVIMDLTESTNPKPFSIYQPDKSELPFQARDSEIKISLEDVEIFNETAIFAARSHGVLFYDISDPQKPRFQYQIFTRNAWSLLIQDDVLYVADSNQGVHVIDISDLSGDSFSQSPVLIQTVQSAGTPKDIKYNNGYLYVAAGAGGLEVYEVLNPLNISFQNNYRTNGFASRVGVRDNLISVSAWQDIEIFQRNDGDLNLVGYKNSGGRVMATAIPASNIIFSAEWSRLRVFEYGVIHDPDIDFSTRVINFPRLEIGNVDSAQVTIYNNGRSPLNLISVASNHKEFKISPDLNQIGSLDSVEFYVIYSPTSSSARGQLNFVTNDPDEEKVFIQVNGNHSSGVQTGIPAPDFSLPVIENSQQSIIQLSDLKGDIVIVVFFASW